MASSLTEGAAECSVFDNDAVCWHIALQVAEQMQRLQAALVNSDGSDITTTTQTPSGEVHAAAGVGVAEAWEQLTGEKLKLPASKTSTDLAVSHCCPTLDSHCWSNHS